MSAPLIISFKESFGLQPLTFETPKDLLSWIDKERGELLPLGLQVQGGPLNRENSDGDGGRTHWTLDNLRHHCQDWERNVAVGSEPGIANAVTNAKNVASYYESGGAVASGCSVIREAKAYKEKEGRDAFLHGYLHARLGQSATDRPAQFGGYIEGTMANRREIPFGKGGIERVETAAAESEATVAKLEELLGEQRDFVSVAQNSWETFRQGTLAAQVQDHLAKTEENENFKKFHDETNATLKTETEELRKQCETDLDGFKKRIQTDIALAGPIQYWRKRDIAHRWGFGVSLTAFLVLAGLFLWGIWTEGEKLMAEIKVYQAEVAKAASLRSTLPPTVPTPTPGAVATAEPSPAQSIAPQGEPQSTVPYHFVRLGVLALASTLGIWFLRFVARIILSSLHLRDDAAERVVMLKTFLALKDSDVKISDEDIRLALASIFRPATSGLVKDDGVPPGLWDIVTRLKSGGGGS